MSIVRVNQQKLSLWQSAVAEVTRKKIAEQKGSEPEPIEVLEHPAVKATNDFVQARLTKSEPKVDTNEMALESADPHARNVYLSSLAFDIATARVEQRDQDEEFFSTTYWPFSDKDPHFLECAAVYAEYYFEHGGKFLYNDWTVAGKGSLSYGVIDWVLPNDAKVGILGDWGTGMPDAIALLKDLMVNHKPDAIIHLGDIYYSGTPKECASNFADVFTTVFNEVLGPGNRIPVFTIPGNHDYYALGYGFYPMLSGLNPTIPTANQPASYFCLRTADNGWQFLGMDTGYEDSNPLNQVSPWYAGPWLQKSEITWHRDKLENFGGATILLSHHQLFSANQKINGVMSSESEFPYMNPSLMQTFQPYFGNKIAAWLWGHEHNFVMYQNGLFGLSKGRLLGASAFEESTANSPYKVVYPNIPYLDPTKYQLQPNEWGYYGHSYSVIDFSVRTKPTDPVQVSYYAFPSWYQEALVNPQSTFIYSETYALPSSPMALPVSYGAQVELSIEGGLLYIGALQAGVEYYPTVKSTPVTLKLLSPTGAGGQVLSGSTVLIETTEAAAGKYSQLGAWSTHTLYYYSPGYAQQKWIITKLDTSVDNVINYGDAVTITNQSYSGQWMCPTNDGYFTTTSDGIATLFTIKVPSASGAVVAMEESGARVGREDE